jgi:hypothetical protein
MKNIDEISTSKRMQLISTKTLNCCNAKRVPLNKNSAGASRCLESSAVMFLHCKTKKPRNVTPKQTPILALFE